MDKAIKSMLADLDPYTNYFNEQDVVNLFRIMNRWEKVQIEDVLELEEQLLLEKNEKMERRKILEGNNIEESKLERNKI